MIARVLAIAGSDSGGGAGIQADIKAITMLGGFAMTAVTAVTVQNTLGVTGVHAIPEQIIRDQIRAVLDDLGADAIKIGMLGSSATIHAVADAIADVDVPIVLDPVMVAKGGSRLMAEEAVEAMRRQLLPRATLITPNAPELEVLTGLQCRNEQELLHAGRQLLQQAGGAAVLAKGGHVESDPVVDWLLEAGGEQRFTSARRYTQHTHGTGCTLSSAIATGLAKGLPLIEAVAEAREYLQAAIDAAPGLGRGHGPLGHNFVLL